MDIISLQKMIARLKNGDKVFLSPYLTSNISVHHQAHLGIQPPSRCASIAQMLPTILPLPEMKHMIPGLTRATCGQLCIILVKQKWLNLMNSRFSWGISWRIKLISM